VPHLGIISFTAFWYAFLLPRHSLPSANSWTIVTCLRLCCYVQKLLVDGLTRLSLRFTPSLWALEAGWPVDGFSSSTTPHHTPHPVHTLSQLTLRLMSVSRRCWFHADCGFSGRKTDSPHVSTMYRLRILTPIQRSLSNTRLPLQTNSLSFFFHRTPKPKICCTTSCTTATQHRALQVP